MGFGCPICSEKLDRLPAEAQNRASADADELKISATPCGHIFHDYCIQKWLSGNLASSKQCPCCRKDVPRLQCLSLFPTTHDDSILDDSLSQATERDAPCNHKEIIATLKNEVREKDQLYNHLSTEFDTLLEKFTMERKTCDRWMMQAKQHESYKDLANDLKAQLKTTEGQLKICMEELKQSNIKFNKLKCSFEHLRSEKTKLECEFDRQQKDSKELQKMYDSAINNGRIRSTSPVAGTSHGMNSSVTPMALRSKRRFQESILPSEASNGRDANVDSRVDIIFPPTLTIKKAKSTKGAKTQSNGKDESNPTSKVKSVACRTKASAKFQIPISPIPEAMGTPASEKLDETIDISSDNSFEDTIDDELRIRGSVPGAPLPTNRLKKMQTIVSERPVLSAPAPSSKTTKFNFKKPKKS